ncbi:hypothetical protein [Inconstantimicrobium porci]|uniref:Uncharacterized protein n=1 Tax=Inconstantimicrobium porci TaxID=2652291 RepID=A0A7X2MYI1_9CLOT|nr:hypothetical protein [Inconstantimicrobium porci]MSR91405.1 hypothetical protein [Inconstantimicrobium porci]
MDFSFLDMHHVRMKKIGAFSLLFRNSISKGTWKKYGFIEGYEQDNIIFAVLLYIMEQSLKEEIATIDYIGSFIDEINSLYLKKPLTYNECKELAEFIVNNILCDEGKAMYFRTFNFKKADYEDVNISFVKNKIEYVDGVRKVSYSLTEEGYSLLLSTLEIEENLKVTIDEIIFKMHLDKASYDKAVDDIKNIFNSMRIRVQSMDDAIRRIRENPLSYSIDDYKKMMTGNLELIKNSKEKFILHKQNIDQKIKEFTEKDIHISELTDEEKENLNNLRIINKYLGRTIDEDQRIMKKHFSLKEIYGKELENISKMSLIERFNFKTEVYNRILDNANLLENVDDILRPLFIMDPVKRYNINKSLEYQKSIKNESVEEDELLTFDEKDMIEEENRKKIERLKKYKKVIEIILMFAVKKNSITLNEINNMISENESLKENLIPDVRIFREVIIEMLKNGCVDIEEVKEERKNTVESEEFDFQLNKSIVEAVDENRSLMRIKKFYALKCKDDTDVVLKNVKDENGKYRNFICSNVVFRVEEGSII